MSESFDNHVDLKLKLLQSVNDATLIWPVSEYDWFAYVALFTEMLRNPTSTIFIPHTDRGCCSLILFAST